MIVLGIEFSGLAGSAGARNSVSCLPQLLSILLTSSKTSWHGFPDVDSMCVCIYIYIWYSMIWYIYIWRPYAHTYLYIDIFTYFCKVFQYIIYTWYKVYMPQPRAVVILLMQRSGEHLEPRKPKDPKWRAQHGEPRFCAVGKIHRRLQKSPAKPFSGLLMSADGRVTISRADH